ncbi:MAG: hypothetical protein Q4D92_05130 [Slackia sp.]|nr:hypothetical protein [Slackia sp.]
MALGKNDDARAGIEAQGLSNGRHTALSCELIEYAKETLLVALRFLEPAISRLECVSAPGSLFATDGAAVYYDPELTVRSFSEEPARLARDILHMTLHCLFRHPFSNATFRPALWDLACDVAVESCMNDLGLSEISCRRASFQEPLYARLCADMPFITAESLYYRFLDDGIADEEAIELRRAFFVDDHALWMRGTVVRDAQPAAQAGVGGLFPQPEAEDAARTNAGGKDARDSDEDVCDEALDEGMRDPGDVAPEFADDALASMMLSYASAARVDALEAAESCYGAGGIPSPDVAAMGMPEPQQRTRPLPTDSFNEAMQTQWREISLRADVALDDFSQLWGAFGGEFSMALKRSNVDRVDYGEFLRRFVSRDEQMMVNDEEFDYVYYCYGLERYGNMPLIEPLEYADDGRIRDFVIAIDTSASTKGETVAAFVERTCDILEDAGLFSDALNLYLIQCDAQIQDVARIASRADARAWADGLERKASAARTSALCSPISTT